MSKLLGSDMIYVFGSNLAGLHSTPDALHALHHHGAKVHSGEGRHGNSYAVPYRDTGLQLVSKHDFKRAVSAFCQYARERQEWIFALTPIGIGRDDFSKEAVLQWIKVGGLPTNVVLTSQWVTML